MPYLNQEKMFEAENQELLEDLVAEAVNGYSIPAVAFDNHRVKRGLDRKSVV